MELRPLGRTGVKVSSLCLGCMMFGGKTEPNDSYAIIDKAIDQGINFIDTANVYSIGRSEEVTGEALHRNGRRNHVVLATKVHGVMNSEDPNMQGNSRRHIIDQCDASLRRLKTDWIDLYQIHRPQSDIPIGETLRALDDLIRAGKVRYVGSSTFGAWQLVESIFIAKELGTHRFICEQPPYNLLDRRIERELLPMARTYGMAIIPWSPLARGFLAGNRTQNKSGETARAKSDEFAHMMYYSEADFAVLNATERLADERGVKPAQIALAWMLHKPGITAPIVGASKMYQLDEAIAAADITLTPDEIKRLEEPYTPHPVLGHA